MNNTQQLTNGQWHIDGNWFAPRNFLRDNFEDVVFCDHINTTSSAGNWEGLVLQRQQDKVKVILFSQENCFPGDGFSLVTAEKPFMEISEVDDTTDYRTLFNDVAQVAIDMYYKM